MRMTSRRAALKKNEVVAVEVVEEDQIRSDQIIR
jgi:hypothetical protein